MAYDEAIRNITLNADSSLVGYTGVPGVPGSADPNYGKQYRFVKVTGAHQCGLSTAAVNEMTVGIMQNKPQVAGMAATVTIRGVTQVMTGGVFAAGDGLKSDGQGRAVKATLGTDLVLAVATEASTAADQLSVALLRCN